MPITELELLLTAPAEALDVEHKSWLELGTNDEHKALLAKAAIAIANEVAATLLSGWGRSPQILFRNHGIICLKSSILFSLPFMSDLAFSKLPLGLPSEEIAKMRRRM
jgi:hypothetical protein